MAMKKFYYRLMAKGQKTHLTIAGQVVSAHSLFGKPRVDSVYYSPEKHVMGQDLDSALFEVRRQIESSKKWTGLRLTNVDHQENLANDNEEVS